ncbi:MAG: hypothetical protein JJU36_17580 [Phycisphaeraceae bacterium]|nr:hypothetical protein [Phycisphaeraceae bacterium]
MESNLAIVDDQRGEWGPMADLRPVHEFRTGAGLTRWRIEKVTGLTTRAVFVPESLAALTAERHGCAVNQFPNGASDEPWLLVNARYPAIRHRVAIQNLAMNNALIDPNGDLIAVRVGLEQARTIVHRGFMLPYPPSGLELKTLPDACLISRPWHILDQLQEALEADAAYIDLPPWRGKETAVYFRTGFPFKIARDAVLHTGVHVDATRGPVYIGSGAIIHSLSTIEGPCYIGSQSIVAPHTAIRSGTVVGPVCRVAGELSFSIIQGYSNKAHAGFLGHSIVGQWANLGADTQVSNLKNTYGPVRMQLRFDHPAEDSGRTFLGPLIGDFVRTAIGSRIPTGACIQTGSMIAMSGFAPKLTRRFAFLTDEQAGMSDSRRFIDTARKMMARRHVEMSPAEERRLQALILQNES